MHAHQPCVSRHLSCHRVNSSALHLLPSYRASSSQLSPLLARQASAAHWEAESAKLRTLAGWKQQARAPFCSHCRPALQKSGLCWIGAVDPVALA